MASFGKNLRIPANMVFIMWGSFALQEWGGLNLAPFGIFPRQPFALLGILTAPLVHGNIVHLVSNTFPILILGGVMFYFYDKVARQVFFICYIGSGILVWLFARPAFHIGASGVIYGIAFFVIFIGFFRKDFKSTLISIIVVIFYGGLFYGILPTQSGVSWEAHLLGGLVGLACAFFFSTKKRISS
jgi:membrane associated rhomboid family serine protease